MTKIIVRARTSKVGSTVETEFEVDLDEYRDENGKIDSRAIDEVAMDYLWNLVEWDWEIEGES